MIPEIISLVCSTCDENKLIDDFYHYPSIPSEIKLENGDGVLRRCKKCCGKASRAYAIKHPEKISKLQKEWAQNNKERCLGNSRRSKKLHRKEISLRTKLWVKNNPEKHKARLRKRRQNQLSTIKGRLNKLLSNAINIDLKRNKAGQSWKDLVPYNLEQLKRQLKKTIPTGYTWKDFLEGKLHIDHKIPLRGFNYNKPTDLHFLKAWALKNLQLLPAKENILKSDKIEKPFQGVLSI